jgi:hypothetical protein
LDSLTALPYLIAASAVPLKAISASTPGTKPISNLGAFFAAPLATFFTVSTGLVTASTAAVLTALAPFFAAPLTALVALVMKLPLGYSVAFFTPKVASLGIILDLEVEDTKAGVPSPDAFEITGVGLFTLGNSEVEDVARPGVKLGVEVLVGLVVLVVVVFAGLVLNQPLH